MINPIWNPFSRYADKLERQVEKVLKKVNRLGAMAIQKEILTLMQKNLVIVNLFIEAKFKGYKYLSRGARKKLYQNNEKIAANFLKFAEHFQISDKSLIAYLKSLNLQLPANQENVDKFKYLITIMEYLKPGAGRFEYLEGASFGKLLSDPEKNEKMIGDCNQIVTYYTYLYSLKYSINDLRIKILPEHVCLYFENIDIEATSGSLAKYKEFVHILPIVELISTNLLDVSDFRDKQLKIDSREFLKGATLAYNISSERDIVTRNLRISYRNVAIDALNNNQFETAEFYVLKAGIKNVEDSQLLQNIYHNAVIYYVDNKNFNKARFFAGKKADLELKKYINEKEGYYYFDNGQLNKAKEIFYKLGNQQMLKAIYGREFNQIQKRVSGLKDLAKMKVYKNDYRKMRDLAVKLGDDNLVNQLDNILKQL